MNTRRSLIASLIALFAPKFSAKENPASRATALQTSILVVGMGTKENGLLKSAVKNASSFECLEAMPTREYDVLIFASKLDPRSNMEHLIQKGSHVRFISSETFHTIRSSGALVCGPISLKLCS